MHYDNIPLHISIENYLYITTICQNTSLINDELYLLGE